MNEEMKRREAVDERDAKDFESVGAAYKQFLKAVLMEVGPEVAHALDSWESMREWIIDLHCFYQ